MKRRNFENFLDAYLQYADDGFVPPQFNLWSGLSLIAGALERKVWLPWNSTFAYYPNIYVLLVSLPGVGKSTALNKAVDLMTELHQREGTLNIIPSQVTEAKFIELLGEARTFDFGGKLIYQSSGFYWASEASNSLKNVYGDFLACLTDFYDCPRFWEKATKKDDKITLRNVSLNLLAGSTFDYLGKLVTDENIMGGFASRLIYVVHREKLVRKQKFQLGDLEAVNPAREDFKRKLLEDLTQIHTMVGPFRADHEFGAAWEKWYPEFEDRRQSHPSEKMQSLLVRTNTNLLKTAMLFSAARSNDRILTLDDWDCARTVLEPIEQELPSIFRDTKALDTNSQEGLRNAIDKEFEGGAALTEEELRGKLLLRGFNPIMIERTVAMYSKSKLFRTVSAGSDGLRVKPAYNPNDNL